MAKVAFVSVDPVMDLADPQQWNAYVYANSNPTTFSDPTGLLPIGAGHAGYNPRTQPHGGDPCAGAISCVKTNKGAGGAPVKVRECYTAYACSFFSTHADGYTTSGGGPVALRDERRGAIGSRVVKRSGMASIAQAAARNQQMAQIRERDAVRAELESQARIAEVSSWLKYNFTTWEGTENWTGIAADATGAISMIGLGAQVVGAGLCAGSVTNGGITCVFGGAEMFAWGDVTSRTAGYASTGFSAINATANFQLAQYRDGSIAAGAFAVGMLSGGKGAGPARIGTYAADDTMDLIGQVTLEAGTTIIGSVLDE